MRLLTNTSVPSTRRAMLALLLLAPLLQAAPLPSFAVLSEDQGGWPLLLQSVGFMPQPAASARIFVLRAGSAGSPEWPARVENGAYLILEGESAPAESFGRKVSTCPVTQFPPKPRSSPGSAGLARPCWPASGAARALSFGWKCPLASAGTSVFLTCCTRLPISVSIRPSAPTGCGPSSTLLTACASIS